MGKLLKLVRLRTVANTAKGRGRDPALRVFMLPAVLLIAGLFVYPVISLVQNSFTDRAFIGIGKVNFVGLSNYARAFADERFMSSVRITLVYALVAVVISISVSLIVAIALNHRHRGTLVVKGANRIRILLLLPAIMAPAATGIMFRAFLFEHDFGILNYYLQVLGFESVPWLLHPWIALLSVALTHAWVRAPYTFLVFDSGVRQIPRSFYEAATLDGASALRQAVSITLPLVRGQVVFAMIFQATFAFRAFDIVFMLTGGGPGHATRVMPVYIYGEALRRFNFGYAMAQTVIFLALSIVFVLVGLKLVGKAEVRR